MLRFTKELIDRIRLRPIRHFESIEGWLTRKEALALYKLSRKCKPGARIVEIGSWKGKSTYCLAKGLRDGVIVAIDPFDGAGETGNPYDGLKGGSPLLDQFQANLRSYSLLEKIEIKVGPSSRFANEIHEIDMLFIDGDHSIAGCEYDFKTFAPEVKSGGILAFHDYNPRRRELGPTWVVDNLVSKSAQWRLLGKWNSLIAFQRNPKDDSIDE